MIFISTVYYFLHAFFITISLSSSLCSPLTFATSSAQRPSSAAPTTDYTRPTRTDAQGSAITQSTRI